MFVFSKLTRIEKIKLIYKKHRYNCIYDLVSKGENNVINFINYLEKIFQERTNSNYYLEIFFREIFINNNKFLKDRDIPIYEFIHIKIFKENNLVDEFDGVMYSTYTHDYDRDKIETINKTPENFKLSIALWRFLFEPASINNYSPVFKKYPIFVFPQEPDKVGLPSATNEYMKLLGFSMSLETTTNSKPIKLFHQGDDSRLENIIIRAAILSVGQVLVEMTRPDIYPSKSKLLPFDRERFKGNVNMQKDIFNKWIIQNNILEEFNIHYIMS